MRDKKTEFASVLMNRRELLKRLPLVSALVSTGLVRASGVSGPRIRIGACDWSIGKSADVGALHLAREIGLEGVQVNLGNEANQLHVRNAVVQEAYLKATEETGVQLASLAIGELNNVPYKSEERTEQWVWDSVDVAKAFGVRVVLLAFFVKNDLRNDPKGKDEVVRRLRMVAPKAEKMGVILGIESYLSAEEHMDIIQRVGSPAVQVFYDFRNSADAGYDVIKEIKWLGKDLICEIHMKENGVLLGQGSLDWTSICHTLGEMDYTGDGWMQIEWAMPKEADVVKAYQHNLQFLKSCFQY